MNKPLYALLIGALGLSSTALLADTGVLIHEKNGSTVFFSSDDIDYVEFVEDYTPSGTPGEDLDPGFTVDPENPDIDPSIEIPDVYTYPMSYVILPEGTPQQVKDYTGFTVNFNKDNHTANYVAWELLAEEVNGEVATSRNYWVDKELEGCLSTDYGYSEYGYQRGHLCPAADQKWDAQAMKDSNVMANMVPMNGSFNGGIWSTLENKERSWATSKGAIWIVAGPIYEAVDDLYVGEAQARVPSSCFKAFLYEDGENSKAIAFVMTNSASNPGNYTNYAMSIDDLEYILGYDLFPALPDDIEKKVEASFSLSDWN